MTILSLRKDLSGVLIREIKIKPARSKALGDPIEKVEKQ